MKTKIVYVLTSDNSDIYLEQSYVSIYTLRRHNPDAHVVLVVDDATDKTLTGKRTYILNVITEKFVVSVPNGYTKVGISRYLKNTLREHIDGDFLYIDSDTVITDSLEDIDNVDGDVCAVLDNHVTLDKHPKYQSTFQKQAKYVNWVIQPSDCHYFNGGVLFVRDNKVGKELFKRWNEEWEKGRINGLLSDQPSLGKVNAELGYVIKEIDGIWNCQIADNGLRFFDKSKIVHYFSTTIKDCEKDHLYTLMNKDVFKHLKETGDMGEDLRIMLETPKSLFSNRVLLLSGINLDIFFSPLTTYVYVLYNKYRKVYKILSWILGMYGNRKWR